MSEDIRPFAPRALDGALAAHGYVIDGRWWDYGDDEREDAQFYTARARSA